MSYQASWSVSTFTYREMENHEPSENLNKNFEDKIWQYFTEVHVCFMDSEMLIITTIFVLFF